MADIVARPFEVLSMTLNVATEYENEVYEKEMDASINQRDSGYGASTNWYGDGGD